MKRMYCILLLQKNNFAVALSNNATDAVKKNHGYYVASGYDPKKYLACFAFESIEDRNDTASVFDKLGLKFDTRDDGLVEG